MDTKLCLLNWQFEILFSGSKECDVYNAKTCSYILNISRNIIYSGAYLKAHMYGDLDLSKSWEHLFSQTQAEQDFLGLSEHLRQSSIYSFTPWEKRTKDKLLMSQVWQEMEQGEGVGRNNTMERKKFCTTVYCWLGQTGRNWEGGRGGGGRGYETIGLWTGSEDSWRGGQIGWGGKGRRHGQRDRRWARTKDA